MAPPTTPFGPPLIQPLGDRGLVVRFATSLSDAANRAAIAFARRLEGAMPDGVEEIDPNLVSVLLRYDPARVRYEQLAGEVRLLLGDPVAEPMPAREHRIAVTFDGSDLGEVAAGLGLTPAAFVAAHCATQLRVLTTGFAPGFVYLGFHPDTLDLPRRTGVRAQVPAGTVLFAARQTAITATAVPTGWHVIGRTAFANFDPDEQPPTRLGEGDAIVFEATP